jgi:hypothetical protein
MNCLNVGMNAPGGVWPVEGGSQDEVPLKSYEDLAAWMHVKLADFVGFQGPMTGPTDCKLLLAALEQSFEGLPHSKRAEVRAVLRELRDVLKRCDALGIGFKDESVDGNESFQARFDQVLCLYRAPLNALDDASFQLVVDQLDVVDVWRLSRVNSQFLNATDRWLSGKIVERLSACLPWGFFAEFSRLLEVVATLPPNRRESHLVSLAVLLPNIEGKDGRHKLCTVFLNLVLDQPVRFRLSPLMALFAGFHRLADEDRLRLMESTLSTIAQLDHDRADALKAFIATSVHHVPGKFVAQWHAAVFDEISKLPPGEREALRQTLEEALLSP